MAGIVAPSIAVAFIDHPVIWLWQQSQRRPMWYSVMLGVTCVIVILEWQTTDTYHIVAQMFAFLLLWSAYGALVSALDDPWIGVELVQWFGVTVLLVSGVIAMVVGITCQPEPGYSVFHMAEGTDAGEPHLKQYLMPITERRMVGLFPRHYEVRDYFEGSFLVAALDRNRSRRSIRVVYQVGLSAEHTKKLALSPKLQLGADVIEEKVTSAVSGAIGIIEPSEVCSTAFSEEVRSRTARLLDGNYTPHFVRCFADDNEVEGEETALGGESIYLVTALERPLPVRVIYVWKKGTSAIQTTEGEKAEQTPADPSALGHENWKEEHSPGAHDPVTHTVPPAVLVERTVRSVTEGVFAPVVPGAADWTSLEQSILLGVRQETALYATIKALFVIPSLDLTRDSWGGAIFPAAASHSDGPPGSTQQ